MKVLSHQNIRNANDVIVVPDNPCRAFYEMVLRDKSRNITVPVIFAERTRLKRIVARAYNRPNHYHWTQIVSGVECSRSSRVLLHDADMFLLADNFLEDHYAYSLQKDLKVLGISPAWDSWFSENGYGHVTATWEMLFKVEWIRSYPPVLFHGHTNRIGGLTHTFDTSYYVQCLTDPSSIAFCESSSSFIHFNWLISGYRWYVKRRTDYCDERFIIMLLRLLIDEFDPRGGYRLIPTWEAMVKQIQERQGPVSFPPSNTHSPAYRNMRKKIGSLFSSSLFTKTGRDSIDQKLKPFDLYYGHNLS